MSFRLFLVCSFFLLGRPQDILTFLQPARPTLVLTILAMGAMVFGGHRKELSAALSMPESKRYLLFYLIMIVGIPFASHRGLAFQGVFVTYIVNVLFFVLLVSQVTSLQVSGSAFDANDTAYVLLSLFPLCLYFIRFDDGMLKKLVAIAAVFSAIAVVLATGSRGGILGLGTVLLVLLLTKTGGIKTSHKVFLVVMLASTFLLMRDRIDVDRYLALSDVSSDYNVSSEGGRIELWQSAVDLSLANPITGVGVECYPFAHLRARQLAGESFLRWQYTHNSFLQVATEVGLAGFAVFVLINLQSLFTFLRISRIWIEPEAREASEIRVLGGLMLLGFAGLLVSGFFLSQGYSIFSTLYFALAAATVRLQATLRAEAV